MGLRAKPNSSSNNKSINNISISSNNNKNNNNGSSINSIKSDCKVKQAAKVQTSVAAAAAIATTCITSTYRSSSTSALVATAAAAAAASSVRPQTLNVNHSRETPTDQTQSFFGDVLNAWRTKARCNVVPAERTQELFHELSFHPSDKQIGEMLQTAKGLTKRRGSHHSSGLTFGEFCVLAADLKRFRVSSLAPTTTLNGDKVNLLRSLKNSSGSRHEARSGAAAGNELRCTKSLSNVTDVPDASTPVEVFLGGSCNPTTWRADVAIPALQELGISFYNPQVSDWTPDLIELEHRAKEKARVLFFVMDSETRATAGAIEAAHIAGQNCKQLVLILHPYKQDQSILNERISQQEYVDLTRNQLILKELVSRRGLPVLDSIPLGLQRTKEILRGIRDPPSNIATILVVIRGAFDRVNPLNDTISTEQCQRALSYLGYAQSLLAIGSLNKIITSQRASLVSLQKRGGKKKCASNATSSIQRAADQQQPRAAATAAANAIDFELFCVVAAYLSVLQQEIHESGCISPIKGTNVPPPPVYLTNMQGDEGFANSYYYISKNISRTSSSTSVPNSDERLAFNNDLFSQSRDSGTSSPQPPPETSLKSKLHISSGTIIGEASHHSNIAEEESDSNDSVFSSSSSINSINYSTESTLLPGVDSRDVYLGGSCYLRTTWRQEVAIPYFKSHGVSFHLPALHESLQSSKLNLPDKAFEESSSLNTHERTFVRTRRKYRDSADGVDNGEEAEEQPLQEETIREEECTFSSSSSSWSLAPVRNLFNPSLLDSSRVLLFVITNETRSLAPMTLAAHCIGLMYNVVLSVQMLPDDCIIGHEKLTATAVKDYNRGRAYLIDLAKRQGVPVFSELQPALECTVGKIKAFNSRN